MKHLLRMSLSALVLLMVPVITWAGSTTSTVAEVLMSDDNGLIYVYPVGGVQGAPACHGSNGNYYSFKISRSMGKQYLATLLLAQAKGATVRLYGTGTCQDQAVSETLAYFSILN